MINKKRLLKCIIVISLIIIIIFAVIQIRNTLARYETTTTTEKDVDVAFWITNNSFKTQRLLIDDIYPRDSEFQYTFTVSNFEPRILGTDIDDKIAETDMEYELVITTTTNLPLSYEITRKGSTIYKIDNNTEKPEELITDENGTYYREIKLGTAGNSFVIDTIDDNGQKRRITDTFIVKVKFPQEYSSNQDYADLMEDIKIELSARQAIDE